MVDRKTDMESSIISFQFLTLSFQLLAIGYDLVALASPILG